MKQRIRKIDRIMKVQQHLQKEAELKLSILEREATELKVAQESILQAMNDHATLHGLFVDVSAKRLQALSAQASRVETAKAAQKTIAFEKAMQTKRTEKMLSNLKQQERQEGEKKRLALILEAIATGKSASFP